MHKTNLLQIQKKGPQVEVWGGVVKSPVSSLTRSVHLPNLLSRTSLLSSINDEPSRNLTSLVNLISGEMRTTAKLLLGPSLVYTCQFWRSLCDQGLWPPFSAKKRLYAATASCISIILGQSHLEIWQFLIGQN